MKTQYIRKYKLLVSSSLFLLSVLLVGCYDTKEIAIAESLLNTSEKWEASKKGTFKIGKADFGPYKTISSEKLDSAKLKTHSHYRGLNLFGKNETETERKVYSLWLTDNRDTAQVLIHKKIITTDHYKGFFGILDEDSSDEAQEITGEIVLAGTEEPWGFKYRSWNFFIKKASLWYQNDTIHVEEVPQFRNRKHGCFGPCYKGLTLIQNDQAIAALQLEGNKYVWIRNDLPDATRLAIAGFFSTILCTIYL